MKPDTASAVSRWFQRRSACSIRYLRVQGMQRMLKVLCTMSSDEGTSRLNRYLQSMGKASSLSWQESLSGPKHTPVWTCVCKVDGEARGTGTGTHKHIAKDLAANEAWEFLTSEQPS